MKSMDVLFSMWFATHDWNHSPIVLVSNAALRKELGLPTLERQFSFPTLLENQPLMEFEKKIQSKRAHKEELLPLENEANVVLDRMKLLSNILGGDAITVVPNPQGSKGSWCPVSLITSVYGQTTSDLLATRLKDVSNAYVAGKQEDFNINSRRLRETLTQLAPAYYPSMTVIDREIHYNHFHPFRWAWLFYITAFLVLLLSSANRFGFWIFAAGIATHIDGFTLRCLIAGRPPVTNMYESVVWVSLGVTVFAMIFALIHRARVYLLAAAPLAITGLILADLLPTVLNPSIGPLPPVLRDNFWLVIHVLTITLGYAAFALAMGVGHIIIGCALFKPGSIDEKSNLHDLLYRVIQIGVLLLGTGTILGGVWANYSWGRFWGWDPKETWALIALLLYIFAIHGRMVGWWKNFGLSIASVICFNGVLMAWYGVNFVLGKGLHSYGFGRGGVGWVGGIVTLDLLFVGLCLASLRRGVIGRLRLAGTRPRRGSSIAFVASHGAFSKGE